MIKSYDLFRLADFQAHLSEREFKEIFGPKGDTHFSDFVYRHSCNLLTYYCDLETSERTVFLMAMNKMMKKEPK